MPIVGGPVEAFERCAELLGEVHAENMRSDAAYRERQKRFEREYEKTFNPPAEDLGDPVV